MCMHTQAVFSAVRLVAAGKQSRLDTARFRGTRDSGVQVVVGAQLGKVCMEQKEVRWQSDPSHTLGGALAELAGITPL